MTSRVPEQPSPGSGVHHRVFGNGTVLESRYRGFMLRVRFADGATRWVRRHQVDIVAPRAAQAQTELIVEAPPASLEHRRMVEAFKLGIVPDQAVREFTFGRDDEVGFIREWLADPDRPLLLLIGEYGSGKTHLLEYVRWFALDAGYACSMVELDPNEAPLHRPKRVYAGLIRGFRYTDAGGKVRGFRDFIRDLATRRTSLKDHPFLAQPIQAAKSATESEDLWAWIEGQESWRYPKLFDYSTSANLYCHILSGLSCGATELGLKGLLLLFDEAEILDVGATSYQIQQGYNFLRGLTLVCKSARELKEDVGYEWRGQRPGRFGAKSRLQYDGHYPSIPFIWRSPSNLKALFGFAPTNQLDSTFLRSEERLEIESLSHNVLREVFQHICTVYQGAHNYLPNDTVRQRVFRHLRDGLGDNTRMFMKTAIETMDLSRLVSLGRIPKPSRNAWRTESPGAQGAA